LAETKLPDPLSRRLLLDGETDPSRLKALGTAFLEAGREIEAIEFLAKAEDRESLRTLQDAAVERGDVFLMKSASAGLKEEPPVARWRTLAEAATAAGRHRDAEAALRLAAVDG
jgi:hypothetical protein